MLAVPAFRQVQGDVPVPVPVPGGAGGDGDQVPTDGRGPGLRERQAGQGASGADQVVRHGRDGKPGGIRGKDPGGKVGQRPAGHVSEDLFHDRMVAVLSFGLDQFEGRVGEDRVVAPDGEQLVLPGGGCLLVQVADPPDDEPGGDRVALLVRECRVYCVSATSASDTQAPMRLVERRVHPDDDRPAVPAGPGCADGPRSHAGRAARKGGVAAAQPRGGDHRRGDGRADHRSQRVQAPDQQRLALDLGVPNFAPCLWWP